MSSILASLETTAEMALSDKTGNPRAHYNEKDLSFFLQLPAVMCNVFFVTRIIEIYLIIWHT